MQQHVVCSVDAMGFSHHRMGVKAQEFAHKSDAHSPSEDFLSSQLVAVPILVNVQRAEELKMRPTVCSRRRIQVQERGTGLVVF